MRDPGLSGPVAQQTVFCAQQASVLLRLTERANAIALYQALGGGV